MSCILSVLITFAVFVVIAYGAKFCIDSFIGQEPFRNIAYLILGVVTFLFVVVVLLGLIGFNTGLGPVSCAGYVR